MPCMSKHEFRTRTVKALESLAHTEKEKLEVERGILHELFLQRDKNVAYARLFLGVPVDQ